MIKELKSYLPNIPGWHTKRKIVVFESDDWGSIRMPSAQVYQKLLKLGLAINDHYNRNDSLETEKDLSCLFDVLTSVKDKNGKYPIITANCLLANPDFDRIRSNQYNSYFYEPFTVTYKKIKGCVNSFELLRQGISAKIFTPQFHGREHLNVNMWMKALQNRHSDTLTAFDYGLWGHVTSFPSTYRSNFLAACDFQKKEELFDILKILEDGLGMFEKILGYRASSFVAANYRWHPDIEKPLAQMGIKSIQGQRIQLIPQENTKVLLKKRRYTGQKNTYEQINLVRNVYFEPSECLAKDWVNSSLKEIANAFWWHKPAIISSHRVNYIGQINPSNRTNSLLQLKELLLRIIKTWPDVEFLSSDKLGDLITEQS